MHRLFLPSGFQRLIEETVETVDWRTRAVDTSLKRGVNDKELTTNRLCLFTIYHLPFTPLYGDRNSR